jgi:hypothetical protein
MARASQALAMLVSMYDKRTIPYGIFYEDPGVHELLKEIGRMDRCFKTMRNKAL